MKAVTNTDHLDYSEQLIYNIHDFVTMFVEHRKYSSLKEWQHDVIKEMFKSLSWKCADKVFDAINEYLMKKEIHGFCNMKPNFLNSFCKARVYKTMISTKYGS